MDAGGGGEEDGAGGDLWEVLDISDDGGTGDIRGNDDDKNAVNKRPYLSHQGADECYSHPSKGLPYMIERRWLLRQARNGKSTSSARTCRLPLLKSMEFETAIDPT